MSEQRKFITDQEIDSVIRYSFRALAEIFRLGEIRSVTDQCSNCYQVFTDLLGKAFKYSAVQDAQLLDLSHFVPAEYHRLRPIVQERLDGIADKIDTDAPKGYLQQEAHRHVEKLREVLAVLDTAAARAQGGEVALREILPDRVEGREGLP